MNQASRQWFFKFLQVFVNDGFRQSLADNSLFVKIINDSFVGLLVYVDDIMIASNDQELVNMLKIMFLDDKFKLKDLGVLKYFLGLKVARTDKGISLCQRYYALELLFDACLLGCKPRKTPMDPNTKLSQDDGELLTGPFVYKRLIGKLLYFTITKPDLSYSVNRLS